MIMHDLADDDPDVVAGVDLTSPNQWPSSLPSFKETALGYVNAMNELARKLTQVIEIALGTEIICSLLLTGRQRFCACSTIRLSHRKALTTSLAQPPTPTTALSRF